MATHSGERWKKARRAAMARDDSTCQDCGRTEYLHVHHIRPARVFENQTDAHCLENLVVLCKYCHPKWEGEDKRPKLAEAEPGLTINEVVAELTLDTLKRECFAAAIHEVFWRNWACSPGRCSRCLKKTDGELKRFSRGRFMNTLIDCIDLYPLQNVSELPPESIHPELSFCEGCDNPNMPPLSNQEHNDFCRRVFAELKRSGFSCELGPIVEKFVHHEFPRKYIEGYNFRVTLQAAITCSLVGKYYLPHDHRASVYCPDAKDKTPAANETEKQRRYREWVESELEIEETASPRNEVR